MDKNIILEVICERCSLGFATWWIEDLDQYWCSFCRDIRNEDVEDKEEVMEG